MLLRQFLSAHHVQDRQFAAAIGCERSFVSRLRRGRAAPSVALIARIRLATNGVVTGEEWIAAVQAELGTTIPAIQQLRLETLESEGSHEPTGR